MFGFRVRVWGEDKEKRLVSMVKEKRGGVVRKIRVANCLRQNWTLILPACHQVESHGLFWISENDRNFF